MWLRRLVAAAVPVLTFGFMTWIVIAYYAARRRSGLLALIASGYVVLVAVVFVGLDESVTAGSPKESAGIVAMLLCLFGGALQCGLLVTWPRRDPVARRLDPAELGAVERRVRREQALSLVRFHPAIARELNIGRPDLPRFFEDGGLVDVNSVPEPVLAALPGVTFHQAQRIVAQRRAQGGFGSIEDLVAWGLIAPPAAHALRDIVVAVPLGAAQRAKRAGHQEEAGH